LELPTENTLSQEIGHPDFEAIHTVHSHLKMKLGLTFQDWFLNEHSSLLSKTTFELTPIAFGQRSLRNQCLSFLVASGSNSGKDALKSHFFNAKNMTEEICGLQQYISTGIDLEHEAIVTFYNKWKHDSLVMQKWFSALAAFTPKNLALSRISKIEMDPLFKKEVPNYLRSLYLQFSKNNLHSFHAIDGLGYKFLAEKIQWMDSFNPQVASRVAGAFSLINKLDDNRKEKMKSALDNLMQNKPSRDTYEVISKYLSQ
jgi:aminopeptidase N